MLLFDTFLYFNRKLIFPSYFHPCYTSCISIKNSLLAFRVPVRNHNWLSFQSPLHECDNLSTELIWEELYSNLAEHVLLATKAVNQSEEVPEIVADEDENRKIAAAEALKKLDEVKNFIEVSGSDHLNMIFNGPIENVEQMKLKNKKQSDIRSFFRS